MAIPPAQVDVLVWGGGTGGVAAALQAARGGATVLLLTPGPWLGGMVSAAGVCAPDGNELTPWQTGLWGAFLRELQRREPEGLDHNWVSCFGYRPATAETLLREWCSAEPLLHWSAGARVTGAHRQGRRLTALDVEIAGEAHRIQLQVVIDGSDRGDLLPICDASYRQGWEAQELWQEPSAPLQARLDQDPFFAEHPLQSPTWVVMGQLADEAGAGTMPGLQTAGPATLPPPFEQADQAFGLERTISYGRLPGGLVMLNWPLHGNDWHGHGLELLELEAADGPIGAAMQAHSLAFAHALEQASEGWLKPAACFPTAGGLGASAVSGPSPLALMPYWREGRRLVGHTVVLEQHLLPLGGGESQGPLPWDGTGALDAVAVGNYANDHHYPGPDWPLATKSIRWGGRWSGTPFTVPYRALLSADFDNLLAADKCFSVSHMANGATRLQPLILNIGQAAGAAAALAVQRGLPPCDLPVRELQERLIHDRLSPAAVLPLWDTPWHAGDWADRQLLLLESPDLLQGDGQLQRRVARANDPRAGAAESGEAAWRGTVQPDGQGGFLFSTGSTAWPLITLEPGLNRWLQDLERPTTTTLVGCLNPWGPWLRASRLAGD
ncbi:FAD-dependent oxidoreductase [Cyanobium sp. Aljojuca 7D2]|uniref:FAD-dependent oxidoreductase n=1 Tax=Cyanobium sp. Aljojuca 7D2 TaxID=2823698 RepID=UPI0020CB887D|nr:FAD-dependent oxidoreductase [Cyanobium sp. Aljojuca 7D2]MCP9889688.1 FAD-dependent oxidoreductase [Cyanobium sp. Aljojuca 7D2]